MPRSRGRTWSPLDYGARGDGRVLDTGALQEAIDACGRAGGGTVLLRPGVYLTAPLRLRSRVTLELAAGSTLLGTPDLAARVLDGLPAGILFARDADHVRIRGEGTIDGNYRHFVDLDRVIPATYFRDFDPTAVRGGRGFDEAPSPDGPVAPGRRPGNLIVFARCTDVRIDGVTITGSSMWTIHCADCSDVSIHDVVLTTDQRTYNSDGIHLTDCHHVDISRCRIATGDDCIAISGQRGLSPDPADAAHEVEIALGFSNLDGSGEDIDVSDCDLSSRSSAVRIWSLQSSVRHVALRRLRIKESNRGIGIFLRSDQSIDDVLIEDVEIETRYHTGAWWGWAEPLHVSAAVLPGHPIDAGRISGIRVSRLRAVAENGIVVYSDVPGVIRDVALDDVSLTIRRGAHTDLKAGHIDLRNTSPARGITQRTGASLLAVNVEELRAHQVEVTYPDGRPPYWTHAPRLEHVAQADMRGWMEGM